MFKRMTKLNFIMIAEFISVIVLMIFCWDLANYSPKSLLGVLCVIIEIFYFFAFLVVHLLVAILCLAEYFDRLPEK